MHDTCGDSLMVGDVCKLILVRINIQDIEEEAIKVVKMVDGNEACMVGFVSRSFTAMERVYSHVGGFIEINEVYKNSTNEYKKRIALRNKGMASATLIMNEPDI